MKIVTIRPHKKYGSAIFVRSSIQVALAHITEEFDIEILTKEIGKYAVTSIYNPRIPCLLFKNHLFFMHILHTKIHIN